MNLRPGLCVLFICFSSIKFYAQVLAGGTGHSLAVCSNGFVHVWGRNNYGQLGDSTLADSAIPLQINSLTNVRSISASDGEFSLALKNDSTVWAWGRNNLGQLGAGSISGSGPGCYCKPLTQVSGLSGIIAIDAGRLHSLALKNDGTVWAWGYNNFGTLGDSTTINRSVPVQVKHLSGVIAIAAGSTFSLALKNNGTVWAWGRNNWGQLGDSSTTNRLTPVQVSNISNIIAIDAGQGHALALKNDSTVWTWGAAGAGQLGNGSFANTSLPGQLNSLSGIKTISAGNDHSLALKSDGTAWAWGDNTFGELGDSSLTNKNTPVQVLNLNNVISISASSTFHSLAMKSDSSIWAWGYNGYGQLGDGTFNSSSCWCKLTPVQVIGGICPNVTLGMDENTFNKSITLFPNPCNGVFTLQSSETILSVNVTDMLGEKNYEISFHTSDKGETIVSLPPVMEQGIYFARIKTSSGMFARKIIVQ